jgi:NAD(P)-dependent dehydrogenase (short-subunit alcohol dehydrogenase family)
MVIRFDRQVAVVTGAGRGLGAAHARLLAELGAAVVVGDYGVASTGTHPDCAVADGVWPRSRPREDRPQRVTRTSPNPALVIE